MTHSEPFSAFSERVVSAVPLSERRGTAQQSSGTTQHGTAQPCAVAKCKATAGTDGIICPDHRARLAAALDGGLARLYVELNLALRPGRAGTDEPTVSVSRAKRLPLSIEARSSQQNILAAVLAAETALRLAHGFVPVPRRGREGPQLVGSCAVLLDYLDEVLALPDAAEHAARILAVIGGARHAAGKTRRRQPNRIDLPCPACDMRSLRRLNGTDDISCAYCGHQLTAQQLDDLLDPPIQREAA